MQTHKKRGRIPRPLKSVYLSVEISLEESLKRLTMSCFVACHFVVRNSARRAVYLSNRLIDNFKQLEQERANYETTLKAQRTRNQTKSAEIIDNLRVSVYNFYRLNANYA